MSEHPRERFQDLLKKFGDGMLVTRDTDDHLWGRPMRVAEVDSDADLWFCTEIESAKTEHIAANPDVVVVFQDGSRYLTVSGKATISRDRQKIDQLWNESWKVWFPDGQNDPDLALLHVDASQGEYWDNSGLRGVSYGIRAGKAYWEGETPDVPDDINAKVSL